MKLNRVVWIACALVLGCKGGSGDEPAATGGETSKPEAKPTPKPEAAAREVKVELSRPPTGTGAPVPVSFTLPAGWAPNGDRSFMPENDSDVIDGAQLELAAQCQGSCAPADLPANIDQVIAGIKENAARPNLNTGNPELDAVRGKVDVLDERALPHGKLLAYRVTYSKEVLASGPYRQRVNVRCFVRRPGDPYYVAVSGSAPIAEEAERLPELVSACESASITEPEPATP